MYKILDPINQSKNETILKDYGMFNNEIKRKKVIKKTPAFYLNYRRVTTQSGLTQLFKMSGYGFSGDKNLEQILGNGAVRVDFDCTLFLHVEAIKQKKNWRGIFDSKFH